MKRKRKLVIPIFIILCYLVILFNPIAILQVDWLTEFTNMLKTTMLEHIEIATIPFAVSFMYLLIFKKSDVYEILFDSAGQIDKLKTELESNQTDLRNKYKETDDKIESFRDELSSFTLSSKCSYLETDNKIQTIKVALEFDYKKTFQFTNSMSSSLIKICNHTALSDLKEFKTLSKEYCKSTEDIARQRW